MFYRTSRFRKQFKKFPEKLHEEAFRQLAILARNEFDGLLNNHKLSGEYAEHRSINVTSDVRIVYQRTPNGFKLVAIGTHSELYE